MKPRDSTHGRKDTTISQNLQPQRNRAQGTTSIPGRQASKRIHQTIQVISRIPNHVCAQKERQVTTGHRLPTTQQHHGQRQNTATPYYRNKRSTLWYEMVYYF